MFLAGLVNEVLVMYKDRYKLINLFGGIKSFNSYNLIATKFVRNENIVSLFKSLN